MSGLSVEVDEITSPGAYARLAAESEGEGAVLVESAEVMMYEITSLTRTDLPCARERSATWTCGMLSGLGYSLGFLPSFCGMHQ